MKEFDTIDDLMHHVLSSLLEMPFNISTSKGEKISELMGNKLVLKNPRARISLTESRGVIFSALGEFLWYLTKDNRLDFIEYYIGKYKDYSDDQETIYGGYGKRLFNMHDNYNQINNVIEKLKKNPSSKKAVIQLFDAVDIVDKHSDVPCTCTMQFLIREGKLNMITYMRSNDALWGLPHDIFCFTMLQEIIAVNVNIELGYYIHMTGSLHLYESKKQGATDYLKEGFQSTKKHMPQMPSENSFENIQQLMVLENQIRTSADVNISDSTLHPYWLDLARLLQAFSFKNEIYNMEKIMNRMHHPIYKAYIEKRLVSSQAKD